MRVKTMNKEYRKYFINNKIFKLKQKLRLTDYQAIKYAEGFITVSEYAPIREQRNTWRAEINKLEQELQALGN